MNNMTLDKIESIFKDLDIEKPKNHKYFSVLAPLVDKEGELHLLYEVRSDNLKRQPGEICFPGGAIEKGETRVACAIRETVEELGVNEDDVRIICHFDTIHTYSNFTMYAFLGIINYEKLQNAKISKDEVKEVFLVPLSYFVETEPHIHNMEVVPQVGTDFPYEMLNLSNGYNWRKGKNQVTIFRYEDRVIWGLTGRITHNLANIIKDRM